MNHEAEAIDFYKNVDINVIIMKHLMALTDLTTKEPLLGKDARDCRLENSIRCLQSFVAPLKDNQYEEGIMKADEEYFEKGKITWQTWSFKILDQIMLLLDRKTILYTKGD